MIQKTAIRFVYLFSIFTACYASAGCPQATPTNTPEFCHSFEIAAQCHCASSGLPSEMCTSMSTVYDRMIAVFRSVDKACRFQHDTSYQNCIDSWHCYRDGGVNSRNEPCSGTGANCA